MRHVECGNCFSALIAQRASHSGNGIARLQIRRSQAIGGAQPRRHALWSDCRGADVPRFWSAEIAFPPDSRSERVTRERGGIRYGGATRPDDAWALTLITRHREYEGQRPLGLRSEAPRSGVAASATDGPAELLPSGKGSGRIDGSSSRKVA